MTPAITEERLERRSDAVASRPASSPRKARRRKTSHLKLVPETKSLRESLRSRCMEVTANLDKSQPLSKDEMEAVARRVLDELGLAEGYVGWTMVILTSAFWRDQVAATPPARRLFLLPHCLKHAEGCPADYDEFGLDCKRCGACSIADFRGTAEEMGYKVLVAEGSPIVLKIIVSGYVDAIIGVACLNVLERAIDKILMAGIPCMAVPLLSSDCRNTSVDEDWVDEMMKIRQSPPPVHTRTFLHIMRSANDMFDPGALDRLIPRARGRAPVPTPVTQEAKGPDPLDPVAATEAIAYDFLSKGGKHSRPFLTLAAYDALTGDEGTLPGGAAHLARIPDSVRRTALAIEIFHKASLVHDDVEDDDDYRYGNLTLHRKYGIATAVNVGDYLIGMGYRMVTREAANLGPDVASDILDRLADAHTKLAEGQGAELMWRDSPQKVLTPLDALKIYTLKTAPAFEVALYAGLRLAGPTDAYREPVRQLAKNLGVAFQILNDLKDWETDDTNKMNLGSDVRGSRPTLLWALALDAMPKPERSELESAMANGEDSEATFQRVAQAYVSSGVFEKAHRLVDKYQERAETVADDLEPEPLRRLLYYLIDSLLERPDLIVPQVVTPIMPAGVATAPDP